MIRYIRDWLRARKTGFIRQESDCRDRPYKVSGSTNLPARVDLREHFLTPRNQGGSQACTGFAVEGLVEYYLNKDLGLRRKVSPLHLWIRAKELHGYPLENKGVWLRNNLKALFNNGFVYELNFPFNNNYLRPLRNEEVFIIENTTRFFLKGLEYTILNAYNVKDSIAKGRPVVFGIVLNNSFYGNTTGIIKDKEPNNYSHAMLVVGYDNNINCFIVRNSWGENWGDKGYCYIPYDYFIKNSHDLWTIDYKVIKSGKKI